MSRLCFLRPCAEAQNVSALPSRASAEVRVEPALCCPLVQWPYLVKGETEAQKGSAGLRSHS